MRKKTLFGDQNFVSGDLFTGVSRQKATWEKIELGALASTVPLDITSCYYQSSLLSFTSIAQIFQSGQSQHCSVDVCFYTYDTFYVALVLSCVRVCTNRCLCTTSSLYVQRSAQNYTTTQSKQIFHQASVTFLDLPI